MALEASQLVVAEPGVFGVKEMEAEVVICDEVRVTALVQAF